MSRVRAAPAPMRLQDRPGRWKLIWRRQRQMLRPALAGSVLIGGLLLLAGLVHLLGHGENFRERLGSVTAGMGLRVQSIVIEGRNKAPEPLVRAALGVHAGDPILTYCVADARARLETIVWV